ncbi:MAG: glycosyltransferase [Bryobacteraceae bacterium]|nr:glycosyltransferase [Bryobacteraceae bacterium]
MAIDPKPPAGPKAPDEPAVPKVSVIAVSRNQADEMRRTLSSLAPAAKAGAVDVVVVDLASTDGGATLDQEFPHARYLRSPRHFGWTRAVNQGTRTALGEYICLCPPGVEFESDTLAKLVERLEADSGALAVAALAADAIGVPVTRIYGEPDADQFERFYKTGQMGKPAAIDVSRESIAAEYIVNAPLLLRRRSLAGMNYLDERYGHFWADAEIFFQVRRANKSAVLLPGVRVKGAPVFKAIPEKLDKSAALLSADAAHGGAQYLGKHRGFMAGLSFRIRAALWALGRVFTFQQVGAQIARLIAIVTLQKIDGTQGR